MKGKLRGKIQNPTFASKIRMSYLMLMVPLILFPAIGFFNLWMVNRSYEDMINSTVVATEFSLDFKNDFDYETYLVIVGNKSMEECDMKDLLGEANRIVSGLEEITDSEENRNRLNNVKKYLGNLEIYTERIHQNLDEGDKYEENMEIWENDVQIVTTLVQENFLQYIYYEAKELQLRKDQYQEFYTVLLHLSLILLAGVIAFIVYLFYEVPLSIATPLRRLSEVSDVVAKGDFSVRFDARSGQEVSMLSDSLNTMIDKINELLEQITTEQVRLRKAEFELLQAQINPHFLYNTLDAIVWLAESGEQKKVVSMVGSLSEFFRTSLNQGKDIVTIREELNHVRSYLEIQQVRYQDILNYEISVPEELNSYSIPKITIQPLVENALYHGIKNKRGKGNISITGRKEGDNFVLEVKDDGIGIDAERLAQIRESISNREASESEIYGLYNVNERIRLNFGEQYGIAIDSVHGQGTTVKILLPCAEKNEPIS